MPRMSAEHPFEDKIFEFATRYSEEQIGEVAYFFVSVTPEGKITHVHTSRETPDFTVDLSEGIFEFDPFDWPEYASISWSRFSRSMMESLIGKPFEDSDFPANMSGDDSFPLSWEVVF